MATQILGKLKYHGKLSKWAGPVIASTFGAIGYLGPERNLKAFGFSGELTPLGAMLHKLENSCLLVAIRRQIVRGALEL